MPAVLNGGMGNCNESLAHGAACLPSCNSGYTLHGRMRCTNGNLTAVAKCLPRGVLYQFAGGGLDGSPNAFWDLCDKGKGKGLGQPAWDCTVDYNKALIFEAALKYTGSSHVYAHIFDFNENGQQNVKHIAALLQNSKVISAVGYYSSDCCNHFDYVAATDTLSTSATWRFTRTPDKKVKVEKNGVTVFNTTDNWGGYSAARTQFYVGRGFHKLGGNQKPTDGDRFKGSITQINVYNVDSTDCIVSAPPNGGMGNCSMSIAHGWTCLPSCNSGYTRQGMTSCTDGTLTAAKCKPRGPNP